MPSHDESKQLLANVELAVREALSEIQRGCVLCTPPGLEQQQLEGAVRIVMRQLARRAPELMAAPERAVGRRTAARKTRPQPAALAATREQASDKPAAE